MCLSRRLVLIISEPDRQGWNRQSLPPVGIFTDMLTSCHTATPPPILQVARSPHRCSSAFPPVTAYSVVARSCPLVLHSLTELHFHVCERAMVCSIVLSAPPPAVGVLRSGSNGAEVKDIQLLASHTVMMLRV